VTFSVLYVGLTRGHFLSTDEIFVFQVTESLWNERDLTIPGAKKAEAVSGRGGHFYAQYNSGQSIAALPLYAAGRAVRMLLERNGRDDWAQVFAGREVAEPGVRWSGQIEIFFVNLLNAFIVAALCALFFHFSVELGARIGTSLTATVLLGCTTYIAAFSTNFMQHASEAFFSLLAFYFLFRDRHTPSLRFRLLAGGAVALMLQFRFPALFAVPPLVAYHLYVVWRRRTLNEITPFLLMVAGGFVLHALDEFWKFGTLVNDNYRAQRFDNPLLRGLEGFLLSPGASILLFTPLLIVAPMALRQFGKRFRAETLFIVGHFLIYLLVYSKYRFWHGMDFFGPRYLASTVPLLLLPLALWLEKAPQPRRIAVGVLAAIGAFMQVLSFSINFWTVILREGHLQTYPRDAVLFETQRSPILGHLRGLLAADDRVDLWLANVYRDAGVEYLAVILTVWLVLLAASALALCVAAFGTKLVLRPQWSAPDIAVLLTRTRRAAASGERPSSSRA
jgi:hypothetical protein